jgi:hypothetical protein
MESARQLKRERMITAAGAALLAFGLIASAPRAAHAGPEGYTFTRLAIVPGPGPGIESFVDDFEPHAINAAGNVAFAADLMGGGSNIGEGVFASRAGKLLQIMSPGDPAPGGHNFSSSEESGVLGMTPLNNPGAGAFAYILDTWDPATPLGLNSGLYRFSLNVPRPSAVVVPGVTPSPTGHPGDTFAGVYVNPTLDDVGHLVFAGIAPYPQLTGNPGYNGLGVGLFMADSHDRISKIVAPGDPAPQGGVFDDAFQGWMNNRGTIGFEAHVAGEECVNIGSPLVCGAGLYSRSSLGRIRSIAQQGDPAPGGGHYRQAFGAVMNDRDDLVFIGDLTPAPDLLQSLGVFLNSAGKTSAVARPGDAMPGGGHFVTASEFPYVARINNVGTISFVARLDTQTFNNGAHDTGLYARSNGNLQLVARTGTVISGVGTIAQINNPLYADQDGAAFFDEPAINDAGQIFFEATLTDGSGVLLIASPHPTQLARQ